MKKRNLIYTLLFGSVALLSSCNDYLDKLPDNRQEINTPEKASSLLVTAYPYSNPAYLLEMYSDNTDEYDNPSWSANDRFQEQAYKWQDITEVASQETPSQLWNTHYIAIATANTIIQKAEEPGNADAYRAQKGEALLCRAYSMFQLTNVFCKAYSPNTASTDLGLPYPTIPSDKIESSAERGTLEQVYKKIEADILEGIPLLNDNYQIPKMHFTTQAAYAFAARFYLYYRQYNKAIEYANRVLGDNPESKLRDWSAWNALESNGQIQPNAFVRSSNKANILLRVVPSEWGAVGGPTNLGNKYAHGAILSTNETIQATGPWGESTNLNIDAWFANAMPKYLVRKIPLAIQYIDENAGSGIAYSEYAVFTTDETLLVRAEANALLGNYEAALKDFNSELSVFTKNKVALTLQQVTNFYNSIAYYTPFVPTVKKKFNADFEIESQTQEPLLQAILHLKRLITIHEGFRMQDIKRYGITIYRRKISATNTVEELTDSLKANDPRVAIQLPADVISAGLQANPRN